MKIDYHRKFVKKFNKLPQKIKSKFYERLRLFEQDPFNLMLKNHSVGYIYQNWRSIDITWDYRALFELQSDNVIMFMKIGTYSELYK